MENQIGNEHQTSYFLGLFIMMRIMSSLPSLVFTRVGHAYAEYAAHADYAQMREYADADGNLIHIIHIYMYMCLYINICQKWQIFGPKMGQPRSVFNSECPKYHHCSSHLVLSILRNEK